MRVHGRRPRMILGLPLLTAGVAGCERPKAPAISVPVAHEVPLEAFAQLRPQRGWRAKLACSWVDPSGALLLGEPAVVEVGMHELRFGEVRIPLDGSGRFEEEGWKENIEPLWSWSSSQRWIEEGLECLEDRWPKVLVRAAPEVPPQTLMVLAPVLDGAELWLQVDAGQTLVVRESPPPAACYQDLLVHAAEEGGLVVGRAGGGRRWDDTWDDRALSSGEAMGPALLAVAAERPWADTRIAWLRESEAALGVLAPALSSLLSNPRLSLGLGGYTHAPMLTPIGSGPTVAALPVPLGLGPGECLFAQADPTCTGLDGALHLEDADNCRDGPALALFELERAGRALPVAIDGEGQLFFPAGEPDGPGAWTLRLVEGNEARRAELRAALAERGVEVPEG